ncbi:UvrD-helicase domain-containing protein [Dermatophilaceae bacterium Soc4.6]
MTALASDFASEPESGRGHYTLDPAQELAAVADADARRIVIAGPGAGKSEVVGSRCRYLLEQGVYPEEILVVSFSHAAVEVVRNRTKEVVDEGRGVDCTTLDSLATRVRAELDDDISDFTGYDDSIRRATLLLESSRTPERAENHVLADVRHLIVDEVQDVVGIRAAFLLALLEHALDDAGFTLLGDPLQGLYDFQLDGPDGLTSQALLDTVTDRYRPETIILQGEYRSRTPQAAATATARTALAALTPSDQLLRLTGLCADLPTLGDLDHEAADAIRAWTGTTALLCDTNVRAGLVAAALSELGLPVETAAATSDPSLAPWIGLLLADHHARTIGIDEFADLVGRSRSHPGWPDHPDRDDDPEPGLDPRGGPTVTDRWRTLMRVSRSTRGLDLVDLAARLRQGGSPLPLRRKPGSMVTASTVHRAKGLEFDNVIMVDPETWQEQGQAARKGVAGVAVTHAETQTIAAARRMFVALSRARARLARGRSVCTRFWGRDPRTGVWLRRSPRGRGTTGLLLEPRLARDLGPCPEDLTAIVGSAVTWLRAADLVTADALAVPSWTATVGDRVVARTGEVFGELVRRQAFRDGLPGLTGGRVEGLETLVGPAGHTAPDGYDGPGRHGLWVGARLAGPLSFEWEDAG